MFRLAVVALLAATASAFAPSAMRASKSSTLKMSYESEAGAIGPIGFFDPLGLSANIDQATFDQYRTAELKHGRGE
jgi:hypothetical protein